MIDFVFQFLTPVLGVIAGIFILAIFRESKKNHEKSTKVVEMVTQNTNQLNSIDSTVTSIKKDFEDIVIPKIGEITSNNLTFRKMTFGDVEKCLADLGIKQFSYLNKEKTTIIFGLQTKEILLNYVVYLTEPFSEITALSFATAVSTPTPELMEYLLNMNITFKLGAVGMKRTGEQNVITIAKSLVGDAVNLTPANLNYVLQGLLHGNLMIQKFLRDKQNAFEPVKTGDMLNSLKGKLAA